ncbi:MAG: hypothetical protein Q8S84_05535 [bacterium]|nr:hypothetical protein [bacterium]
MYFSKLYFFTSSNQFFIKLSLNFVLLNIFSIFSDKSFESFFINNKAFFSFIIISFNPSIFDATTGHAHAFASIPVSHNDSL